MIPRAGYCFVAAAGLVTLSSCQAPREGQPEHWTRPSAKGKDVVAVSQRLDVASIAPGVRREIITKDEIWKEIVSFTYKGRDYCYLAMVFPHSRAVLNDDGTIRVEDGAVYVDSDVNCRDDRRRPLIPDEWVWISTSRADAGAEGSALMVSVEPGSGGIHRVFFLKGTKAFIAIGDVRYPWYSQQNHMEINSAMTPKLVKNDAGTAVQTWLTRAMGLVGSARG